MYHSASRSRGLQKMFFRDVLRFQKLLFQYVLRFQDASTSIKNYPTRIQGFSKISQIYQDLLGFQDHPTCFRISKILLRFHHVEFPCFLFKQSLTPTVLTPPKINFILFGPTNSNKNCTLTINVFFDTHPSEQKKCWLPNVETYKNKMFGQYCHNFLDLLK